jgi:hypothetical protein
MVEKFDITEIFSDDFLMFKQSCRLLNNSRFMNPIAGNISFFTSETQKNNFGLKKGK